MKSQAAVGVADTWQQALDQAIAGIPMLEAGDPIDLVLLFATDQLGRELDDLLQATRRLTGAAYVIGCSAAGVIGAARELEGVPALALQAFSLPDVLIKPFRISQDELDAGTTWLSAADRPTAADVNAFLLFVDPYTLDSEKLLKALTDAYPFAPLMGGLASGYRRPSSLFLGDKVYEDGVVGIALGGDCAIHTVVSQGCEPIGESWTITGVTQNSIDTIGMRPALDVLRETFDALPDDVQDRARRNLFVGLAMNEYKDEFGRGDFLVRNLVGVDEQTGAIGIGAYPRVGQTIQFQLRDPKAADDELRALLQRASLELAGESPAGALLCSCTGRGENLFGTPDHDALAVDNLLGGLAVSGFFCAGEIGPVGGKPFLHSFTASLAVLMPKSSKTSAE